MSCTARNNWWRFNVAFHLPCYFTLLYISEAFSKWLNFLYFIYFSQNWPVNLPKGCKKEWNSVPEKRLDSRSTKIALLFFLSHFLLPLSYKFSVINCKKNQKRSFGRKSDLLFSICQRTWKSDYGDKLSAIPEVGNCSVGV